MKVEFFSIFGQLCLYVSKYFLNMEEP